MSATDCEKTLKQVIAAISKTAAGNAAGIDIEVRLTNSGTGLKLVVREWVGCTSEGTQDWKTHIIELPADDATHAQRKAVSFASGILAMAAFRKMARMREKLRQRDI